MESNKEKYHLLCQAHPEMPVFLQAWWLDAACGNDWDVLFLLDAQGAVKASLSFLLRRKYGFTAVLPPLLTPFQGLWVFSDPFTANDCAKMLSDKRLQKLGMYQQSFNYRYNQVLEGLQGYRIAQRYTYRLDPIPSVEDIIQAFPERKQRLLRSQTYQNLKVKTGLDAALFYNAYRQELAAKGSQIFYSFEYFNRLYQAAKEHQAGEIVSMVDANNQVYASLWLVWDADSAYTQVLYINPQFRNSGASIGVILEAIRLLKGKTRALDFAGSMIKSVAQRNQMFGAERVPYSQLSRTRNPLLWLWSCFFTKK